MRRGVAASICRSRPPVASRLNGLERQGPIGLPGLSEPQVIRHFTRLSQKNYAIDSGLYPLGSCTMKHNPRLNEKMARLPGFADIHPLQPESTVQGALELIRDAGALAQGADRDAGGGLVAGRRGAWRIVRHHGDPRRARSARRQAQPHPGAGIGAWHEPGDRGCLRLFGRGRSRPTRAAGSISPR